MRLSESPGPAWMQMFDRRRINVCDIEVRAIPVSPGVYAWFRFGEPIYAGQASGGGGLRGRLSKHLGVGPDLSRSSLRRNVAEYLLGIPTSASRQRPSILTSDQVSTVNAWIQELELAWFELTTPAEAVAFERVLLAEWMPPLSKR